MKRIIIESPYAGEVEWNLKYLRACMADSIARGEAPFASHALYTQPGVLDDLVPEERRKGIKAGFAWWDVADAVVFYLDLGWSSGMHAALNRAHGLGRRTERRYLGGAWTHVPLLNIGPILPPHPGAPSRD